MVVDRMEYISDVENGHGPDYLPVGLFGHCLIRITNETLVLTGGINGTPEYAHYESLHACIVFRVFQTFFIGFKKGPGICH